MCTFWQFDHKKFIIPTWIRCRDDVMTYEHGFVKVRRTSWYHHMLAASAWYAKDGQNHIGDAPGPLK